MQYHEGIDLVGHVRATRPLSGHILGWTQKPRSTNLAPVEQSRKTRWEKILFAFRNGIRSVLLAGGDRHCLYETADRSSSKPVHSDPSLTELKQNTQVVKPGICLTSLPSLGLSTGS